MGFVGVGVLARHRERVDLVAVVVRHKVVAPVSRLEHAEAERDEPAACCADPGASVLRARDDVVPRRRQEGRDLVLDRAVRLVVGRQERPDLWVGREAVAEELDGTRLRDRVVSRVDGVGRR